MAWILCRGEKKKKKSIFSIQYWVLDEPSVAAIVFDTFKRARARLAKKKKKKKNWNRIDRQIIEENVAFSIVAPYQHNFVFCHSLITMSTMSLNALWVIHSVNLNDVAKVILFDFFSIIIKFNYLFFFYSVFLRIELHRIAAAGGPFDNRFKFPVPDVKTGRSSFPGCRTYRLLSGCSSSGRVEGAHQPGSRRSGGGHPSWIASGWLGLARRSHPPQRRWFHADCRRPSLIQVTNL